MAKVLFIDDYGQEKLHLMDHIPRIGDVIPFFYTPFPKVIEVIWFPEKYKPDLKGTDTTVLILVETQR